MKASRFSDAEGVHSEAGRRRRSRGGHLPQGGDQPGDLLQLEEEVRRDDAAGDAAAEAAGRREREAADAGGGPVAGSRDAAGRHPPKNLRPGRKRQLVDSVRREWDVSIRRACRLIEFGSMLSTPIINPPQSAILGIHATKDRPVAENGQVVIRPMNYLAMSYDHRIIDGREAVLSLVAIKDALEDPARLLLDL